jgi:Nucleotidyl transferase AbiEii toxin, Type IV TA system
MLTPLQEEVAAVIAALAEAKDFALAGGAALIMREQIERGTRDLDFFGLSAAAVDRLAPAAEQALRRAGFDVERVLSGAGFARLVVQGFGEQTEVDLAADARLFPAELGRAGTPLLASEELAVDKVLAVFGRAEARDFIDLRRWKRSST